MSVKSKIKHAVKRVIQLKKEKELVPIPQLLDSNRMLDGKVALITGGSSGIGYAMAEAFLESGASVIIAGRKESALKECCNKLNGGGVAKYLILDVTDISSIPGKVAEAGSMFDGRLDILVNSAGLVAHHSFLEFEEKEYDAIMDTNLKGTFFMSQAVGKYMIENHIKGHILNLASSSSLRPAWTPYQMSKWGVRGFTLGLAEVLLPYGIVVNAIAPGPTATPMLGKSDCNNLYHASTPAGRYATPSEIAKLAVYMVSDMANMVVGDTFFITGGSGTITMHH